MKKLADRSKEVIIHKKILFGTGGRWLRPLNRGGRLMEVVSLLIYNKYFRDFDNWPFNRVWPLNRGPLNRGSTVSDKSISDNGYPISDYSDTEFRVH